MSFTIPSLVSGGIICTYRCNSRCQHCAYVSGSSWPANYTTPRRVGEIGEVLDGQGCSSIHIGGGEPFLDIDALIATAEACIDSGLHIEYVETNASWYRTAENAEPLLDRLLAAGVSTLLISISPFHNEYIPLSKTLGAIDACDRYGMSVFPWGTQFLDQMRQLDPVRPHRLDEYEHRFGPGYLASIPRRFWLSPRGRAVSFLGRSIMPTPFEEICSTAGPCSELHDTGHFHIDLYGNYVPGVCSGLSIDMNDLGNPVDDERYPFLSRLEAGGVTSLVEYAKSAYDCSPKATYTGKCDLCYDIRRRLVIEYGVDSHDLEPRHLYSELASS